MGHLSDSDHAETRSRHSPFSVDPLHHLLRFAHQPESDHPYRARRPVYPAYAGNIIPPHGAANGGEGATIEFAVAGLGVQDIIVCGHSHCGAMKGLLHPESLTDMPAITAWLSHAEATRRIMREKYADRTGDALLTTAVEENVLVQLENLRTHPTVAAGLARGKLKLHAWVYKIETGAVFAYEPARGQFIPVAEAIPGPVPPSARLSPAHNI